MSTVVMDTDKPINRSDQLAEISQKLDLMAQSMRVLGHQVNYLMEQADKVNRRRQQEWDDLFEDLTPVVNDVYQVAETQLEEMQQFVTLDDVMELVKRLARNTRNLNDMLDTLESAAGLHPRCGAADEGDDDRGHGDA